MQSFVVLLASAAGASVALPAVLAGLGVLLSLAILLLRRHTSRGGSGVVAAPSAAEPPDPASVAAPAAAPAIEARGSDPGEPDRGLQLGVAMAVTVVPGKGRAARKAQAARVAADREPAQADESPTPEDQPPAVRHRRGLTRRGGGRRSTDLPGDPDVAPAADDVPTLLGGHDVDDAPSPLTDVAPPGGDAVHMSDFDTPPLGERIISFPEASYHAAEEPLAAEPLPEPVARQVPDDVPAGSGWWAATPVDLAPTPDPLPVAVADPPPTVPLALPVHPVLPVLPVQPVQPFQQPTRTSEWPLVEVVGVLAPPVESGGWRADAIGSVAHEVFPSTTPANFWTMPPARATAAEPEVLEVLEAEPVTEAAPAEPVTEAAPAEPVTEAAPRSWLAELPDVSSDPVTEHEVVAQIVDDILASLGLDTGMPAPRPSPPTGTVVGPAIPAAFVGPAALPRVPPPVPAPRDAVAPTYPGASGAPSAAQRDALRASSQRLSAAANRISVAEITAQEAASLVEADSAALVVRSVEGPRVLWLHPAGGDAEIWGPQTLAALLGVGGAVREVLAGDPLAGGSPTALLAVPVASAGTMVGTVVVRRNSSRAFTVQEQGVLDRLARMSGAALDALTRRGAPTGEGRLDDVTHLAVRDRLDHDLRAALRSRADHDMPVTLLIAEVDGLARLRTERGGSEADAALELIASSVVSSLRVGDLAYRFGADELAVLLPSTHAEDAELVAERLAAAADTLVAQRLDHPRPLRLRAAVVPVEGVAEEVMAEATRALATERVKDRWTKRRPVPNR